MIEIICASIAGACSIIVAIIGFNIKKSNAAADHRASIRQQESLLSLRMMDATLQLSIVTSNALTGQKNNGNVEKARLAAESAASEYNKFMQVVTANEVGK